MKLVSRVQMNTIDHEATSRFLIPSLILMEHAAHGVFMAMQEWIKKEDVIVIVCGSGNNGGDGFALARMLYLSGYQVALHIVGNKKHFTIDAEKNYNACMALHIPLTKDYKHATVIVDCLFGTGLSRNVEGKYKDVIASMNASKAMVVSMDIPSGVSCDDGKVLGVAVRADYTYTMQCGKLGLYVYPGREYSGKVRVLDILIPKVLVEECESQKYLMMKEEMQQLLPKRKMHSHKGTYGKVVCIGGSKGMNGAISMAALSAMKSGCGMITCAVPECISHSVSQVVLESMSIALSDTEGHFSKAAAKELKEKIHLYDVALIGCGIGRSNEIEAMMKMLLDKEIPLVIDADALYAYRPYMNEYAHRKNVILTPHLKEFVALTGNSMENVVNDSVACVEAFTKAYPEITLVLKSETTIIAKGEQMYVNTYGNNGLAKGGSGDVLAGIITGMYAQLKDPLIAAALGVFLHAYSADEIVKDKSEDTLCPSDIIQGLEHLLHHLRGDKK